MLPNNCRRSGTWTSPSRTIAAERRRTDLPARRMSPAVTGTSPITVLSSVLLPAPFAPISATISPARTSSVASCSTCVRPYPATRPSTSSNAFIDVGSEIGRDHFAVGAHAVGRTVGDLLAVMHDHDGVGEAMTRRMSCSTSRIVMPSREIRTISRASCSVSVSFSPEAGSSISSSVGLSASARDLDQALVAERELGRQQAFGIAQPDEAQRLERGAARLLLVAAHARRVHRHRNDAGGMEAVAAARA